MMYSTRMLSAAASSALQLAQVAMPYSLLLLHMNLSWILQFFGAAAARVSAERAFSAEWNHYLQSAPNSKGNGVLTEPLCFNHPAIDKSLSQQSVYFIASIEIFH